MKIYEIENFLEVCKYKSFSRTAQALYMSRQSLLRSINNLEDEFGHPLFSRGATGVTLTDFGKAFYEKAVESLEKFDELKAVASEYNLQKNSHITIGIRGNFRSAYIMNLLIDSFSEKHPNIEVEIIGCESSDIIPAVSENRMDFGFTVIPEPSESLHSVPLEKLDYALLTNKANPISESSYVTNNMLSGMNVAVAGFSKHPTRLFAQFEGMNEEKSNKLLNTVDINFMYQLVHNNSACGVLLKRDGLIGMRLYDDLVCIPFMPEIYIEMGLIYKGKLSEQKKIFVEYMKKNYNKVRDSANLRDSS